MCRIEVGCDSQLAHVFEDEGYPTATDQRYSINSIRKTLASSLHGHNIYSPLVCGGEQ